MENPAGIRPRGKPSERSGAGRAGGAGRQIHTALAVSDVTRKLVRCVISFSLVRICALALLTEPIQIKCFVIRGYEPHDRIGL